MQPAESRHRATSSADRHYREEFHLARPGRSGIAARAGDERALRRQVADDDWNPTPLFKMRGRRTRTACRSSRAAAAAQAVTASGLQMESLNRDRIGVCWGTGMGGAHTQETSYKQVYGAGEWRVRPLTVVMGMSNAAGSNVAVRHALRGPFANYSTACSSSAMALGEAMRAIVAGRADAMIAGGSEALLTPGVLVAWQALRTLAPADPADAAASCKPFDRRRAGLVLAKARRRSSARGSQARARARASTACSPATAIRATRGIFAPRPRWPDPRDERSGWPKRVFGAGRRVHHAHGTGPRRRRGEPANNSVFGAAASRGARQLPPSRCTPPLRLSARSVRPPAARSRHGVLRRLFSRSPSRVRPATCARS